MSESEHTAAAQKIYPNRIDRRRQKEMCSKEVTIRASVRYTLHHTASIRNVCKHRVQPWISTIFRLLISSVAVFTLRFIYCHALCCRIQFTLLPWNIHIHGAHHFISFWCFLMAQLVNFNGIRRKLYAYNFITIVYREFRAIKMWQLHDTHCQIVARIPFALAILHAAFYNKILNQKLFQSKL